MNKVFGIEIYNHNHSASLDLPATDYQLLDVMGKLRMQEEDHLTIEVCRFNDAAEGISVVLENDLSLFELNALAKRVSEFQIDDHTAFHALVSVELEKGMKTVPLKRLLDLAHSTDCCEVHPGIYSYEELGHFYVENDLVPELKDLPEQALPMLDYEGIGRKLSQEEGGILDPGGYVTQTSDLKEVPNEKFLPPSKPSYTILLGLASDQWEAVLEMPADCSALDHALTQLNADDWSKVQIHCLDCAAPTLIPHIGSESNVAHINRLAQRMQTLDDKQLTKFKAVLEAAEEYSVLGAANIACNLDDYLFSPQFLEPEDMARDFLESGMGSGSETLKDFVNLIGYGYKLMEEQNCVLTDYGMVNREDGQALKGQSASAKQILRGMEEMTM